MAWYGGFCGFISVIPFHYVVLLHEDLSIYNAYRLVWDLRVELISFLILYIYSYQISFPLCTKRDNGFTVLNNDLCFICSFKLTAGFLRISAQRHYLPQISLQWTFPRLVQPMVANMWETKVGILIDPPKRTACSYSSPVPPSRQEGLRTSHLQ